ncbi:hypothetical protein BH23CHL2_BH23CHL2_02770 [soil metagenome]
MSPRIVVAGYCASGKSTLVDRLRSDGVEASAVAQEHSVIDDLWDHYSPDIVIFLDVTVEAIRKRRGNPNWPEWIYELQTERLAAARERADIVVDTTKSDAGETYRQVCMHLGITPSQ